MRHLGSLLLLLALAMVVGAANIPWLLVPDSSRDGIMLFDRSDGSLVDADWPTDAGAVGWAFETPNKARIVGNEIRVADQVADAIQRFSL